MEERPVELSAGKLWGMRRLADPSGRFKMLAADQRPPIKSLVAERRGTSEAPWDDVAGVKAAIVEELGGAASAILVDPHFAYPVTIGEFPGATGLILTLEDSVFEETPVGRKSFEIDDWSVAKIRRAGGDAVKVLAWYRPDASPEVNEHQQEFTARIGAACAKWDIPFVFELLVYPFPGESGHTTDYVEQPAKRIDHVLESVATFAAPEFGVDVFKLESPMPAASIPADPDPEVQSAFDELGRLAGRPWVMLSAGATAPQFRRVLEHAYRAGASGYLAGRAIWWDAFQSFPDMDAMRSGLASEGLAYMADLNALTDAEATPWTAHPSFGGDGPRLAGAGAGFRHAYGEPS
jgi:tagatose 1,6-diphosphate aldolase